MELYYISICLKNTWVNASERREEEKIKSLQNRASEQRTFKEGS